MQQRILPLVVLGLVLQATAWSGTSAYNVSLNTSPLIGHVAGPFALEFQFNDGSGTNDANNTAMLDRFSFSGGTVNGLPSVSGGASGDTTAAVTLTDSSFFNQFVQSFTPGIALTFRLALTTSVDAGGVPDQFTFAILDSMGSEIPTLSPFDVFVELDIDSSNPALQVFASDTGRTPAAGGGPIDLAAPMVTVAPEAHTWPLLAAGLGVGLWMELKKRGGHLER
jgi:hypothetical protein